MGTARFSFSRSLATDDPGGRTKCGPTVAGPSVQGGVRRTGRKGPTQKAGTCGTGFARLAGRGHPVHGFAVVFHFPGVKAVSKLWGCNLLGRANPRGFAQFFFGTSFGTKAHGRAPRPSALAGFFHAEGGGEGGCVSCFFFFFCTM